MGKKSTLAEALDLWPGTVEELADAVGVRRNTLYTYASGRRAPSTEILQQVAELLESRTANHARRAREVAEALRTTDRV